MHTAMDNYFAIAATKTAALASIVPHEIHRITLSEFVAKSISVQEIEILKGGLKNVLVHYFYTRSVRR